MGVPEWVILLLLPLVFAALFTAVVFWVYERERK